MFGVLADPDPLCVHLQTIDRPVPVEVIQEVEVPVIEVVDEVVERQVMVEQIQTVDKPVVQYVEKVSAAPTAHEDGIGLVVIGWIVKEAIWQRETRLPIVVVGVLRRH
jgi:hypothetical protein